jgi:hypothetical protein
MFRFARTARFGVPAAASIAAATVCLAQASHPDVLTYHNDNYRTGQYLSEKTLTPESVNVKTFGKLLTIPMDGKVDAQPLYLSSVRVPIGKNGSLKYAEAVYAATEHDTVYAFSPSTGQIYWKRSLLAAGESPSDARNCDQVVPEIGVTATPVIDQAVGNGIIYVVAMSKDKTGEYHHRLHALDISTGAEQMGGPIEIKASYPGSGLEMNSGNMVVFDPKQHKERAALLLSNGTVYTSWSSHCDIKPYTGWVIGYDAKTLKQTRVFNFEANGSQTSIWNSGGGPAADAQGNLLFSLANGTFDTTLDAKGFPANGDYGNSVVKLTPVSSSNVDAGFAVKDYWTMANADPESDQDLDLGSGGIVLLPDNLRDGNGITRPLAVVAGKDRNIYVVDRNNMGKFDPAIENVWQEIPDALAGKQYGQLAWFNGTVYIGAVSDVIKAYKVQNAGLSTTPVSMTANSFPYPGTNPVISADGNSNAILWAFDNGASGDNGVTPDVPAILHAYDPANLNTEYYNSDEAANGRDHFGPGNKFITPTVANGRVLIGTTNSVVIFGLLPR